MLRIELVESWNVVGNNIVSLNGLFKDGFNVNYM